MKKEKWILDTTHADVQFKVKHLMISTVTGQFNDFESSVETDGDDFTTAKVQFSAKVDSISTNNEKRDEHLRNADFFGSDEHPLLTFESAGMKKLDAENYELTGTLTIKGVSRTVVLNAEHGGIVTDPWGNIRSGFTVTGKINRQDFGMNFGLVAEGGGLMLGDEVKITASAEFVKIAATVEV